MDQGPWVIWVGLKGAKEDTGLKKWRQDMIHSGTPREREREREGGREEREEREGERAG